MHFCLCTSTVRSEMPTVVFEPSERHGIRFSKREKRQLFKRLNDRAHVRSLVTAVTAYRKP